MIFLLLEMLINNDVLINDICITARNHKLVDTYINLLTQNGIRCFEIKNTNFDNETWMA